MVELVSLEDVKNCLHDLGIPMEDQQSLTALFNMCIVFNVSAETLADSWYEYQVKNPKVSLIPSQGHLDLFRHNFLTKDYVKDNDVLKGSTNGEKATEQPVETKKTVGSKKYMLDDSEEDLMASYRRK